LGNLSFVRGILAKYKYSLKYDSTYFNAMIDKLVKYDELEIQYYNSFFKLLGQ